MPPFSIYVAFAGPYRIVERGMSEDLDHIRPRREGNRSRPKFQAVIRNRFIGSQEDNNRGNPFWSICDTLRPRFPANASRNKRQSGSQTMSHL